MFHVKQRVEEKIIEPVRNAGRIAVLALVIAVIALLAVASLMTGRHVSRETSGSA